MMYAQNAISVNEFHGRSWSKVILDINPSPRGVCGISLIVHTTATHSTWIFVSVIMWKPKLLKTYYIVLMNL